MEEGASSSPYCDPWWWESQLTCSTCRACNGYYGPCFSEPVCATCHAFLYASSLEQEIQLQLQSEEANASDDDGDSGNDDGGKGGDKGDGKRGQVGLSDGGLPVFSFSVLLALGLLPAPG